MKKEYFFYWKRDLKDIQMLINIPIYYFQKELEV